jgi:LuxR family transcriptional regulator, maltose regulon positive regulatory protein
MAIPVISTKLHIPAPPRFLVPRSRLIARLESEPPGKLVLVSAPAGFGKTSLIAEWTNQSLGDCLVSWVHLDKQDNELFRFLSYVIAALQSSQQDIGEAALFGLQSIPPAPSETVLTSLINEIGSMQREVVLILDDYHMIDTTPVHEAVGCLIERLPANMRLVINTRIDPPLPIHRLRARGQLTEIREGDLRFTNEETRSFLEGILHTSISNDDIAALESRIEGWVAGLQLLALSVQGAQDIHQYIRTFSGSHRYIMDYLTEEVYNQQPHHIQEFLLQTSVLERLSGPLCDFLLQGIVPARSERNEPPSAQQMLEYLDRANLFLIPLDDERCWYRYHHLFATLLRLRLRLSHPNEIPGLKQRASHWFADNGFVDEAIHYSLAADDHQGAARLVEQHGLDLLNKGALSNLLEWLNRLPGEIVLERPWLCVYLSWALLLTGKLQDIGNYLEAAETGKIDSKGADDLRGHIAAIRAYASAMHGEADQAIRLATEAFNLLPEDNLSVRSVVAFVLGGVYYLRGNLPRALESMEEAGRIGERAGNIHLAAAALNAAGDLLRRQGDLDEAEKVYARALKSGMSSSGRPLPIAAGVYSSLAELHLARNKLKDARQFAMMGVELAKQWGNVDSLASSYLALGYTAQMEGDHAEAQRVLEEVKRLAAAHSLSPGFGDRIAAYEASSRPGPSVRDDEGFPIETLTKRELDVLKLMAKGCSNPEIAAELIIALGTVKAHTSSIYRKLGARSRTEAVIKAGALGLL